MTSEEKYNRSLELLNAYILDNHMRHTAEREMVLQVLTEVKTPTFTTKQVENEVSKLHISLPTLYNCLRLFVSARILYKIDRVSGMHQEHYGWHVDAKNSMIVVCTNCGRTARFVDKAIHNTIYNRKYANFVPAHYAMFVYGQCRACRRLIVKRLQEAAKNRSRSSIE